MTAPSPAHLIPALSCLRTYDRSWLRSDIFAGIYARRNRFATVADVVETFTGRRSYAGRTTQDLLRLLNGRQFTGDDEY
jgi:hypothetical protein